MRAWRIVFEVASLVFGLAALAFVIAGWADGKVDEVPWILALITVQAATASREMARALR